MADLTDSKSPSSRTPDPAAVVPSLSAIPSGVMDGARQFSRLGENAVEDRQVLARAVAAKFFAKDGQRFHGFMANRYAAAADKVGVDVEAGRKTGLTDSKLSGLKQAEDSYRAMGALHEGIREDIQRFGKMY